jgi:predicted molibdopterin-dependent oxidoreductase YjgC
MVENLWDQLMIEDILLMPGPNAPDGSGFIDYYGTQMRKSIANNRRLNPKYFTGLWQPSCFRHTQDLCTGSPTTADGVQFADALKTWVAGKGQKVVWHQSSCSSYGTCSTVCPESLCP